MTIHLRIDRCVLEGVVPRGVDHHTLRHDIERHLAAMIEARGLPQACASSRSVASRSAPSMQWSLEHRDRPLALVIADAVYEGLSQ
jgi:hypothetical protein